MGAITAEQKFIRALKHQPAQKASFHHLATLLPARQGRPWTTEEVEEAARALNSNTTSPVFVVRGGVQYFGNENQKDCALYKATADGIVRRFGMSGGEPKATPHLTSRPMDKSKGGIWLNPDLIVAVKRKLGAEPSEHFHSIEIEQASGFDIRSIYQAHEQSRGADFAWVYFAAGSKTGIDARTKRAAKELGVGVVRMPQPTAPSKWKLEVNAQPRTATKADRAELLKRIGRLSMTADPLGSTG